MKVLVSCSDVWEHLSSFLQKAVPLQIALFRAVGGPSQEDLNTALAFGLQLAEKGDQLLYRGPLTGKIAGKLVFAIAVLAFLPAGITFCGSHWEESV